MFESKNFNDLFNALINQSGKKLDWAVKQIKTGKDKELYAAFGTPSKSTFNNWRTQSKPSQSLWMFLVACHAWGFSEKETSQLLALANLPELSELYANADGTKKELLEKWMKPLVADRIERELEEIKALLLQKQQATSRLSLNEDSGAETHSPFNRLAELPTDTIPSIQPLPAGSFVPYSINPHFIGRKTELLQIATAVKTEKESPPHEKTVAVTGMGGMGKTQLTVEFAHRYGSYFEGGVFWINCADRSHIPVEIGRSGEKMNLHPDFLNLGAQRRQQLVQRAWQESIPRLLIFDNLDVDAEEILEEFRPKTGGCSLLITSRHQSWSPALRLNTISLYPLTSKQGTRLLQNLAPRLCTTDAKEIAEEVGYFPLALHVAGSFLSIYRHWSAAEYITLLERRKLSLLERRLGQLGQSPTAHELSVGKTFAVSWDRLDCMDETDKLAQVIFSHLVWCAPGEPLPLYLLAKTVLEDKRIADWWHPLDQFDRDDLLHDGIRRLFNLGLLEREEHEQIILHHLLSAFGKRLPEAELGRNAVEIGLQKEAQRCNEQRLIVELRSWLPHLSHLIESRAEQATQIGADLTIEMAWHLGQDGAFKKAIPILKQAIGVLETIHVDDRYDLTPTMSLLGWLYIQSNEHEKAQTQFEKCLSIRQSLFGKKHPSTITAINNLGFLLGKMGKFKKAELHFKESLMLREAVFGMNHEDIACSYINIGTLYLTMKRFEDARSALEQCITIFNALPDPDAHRYEKASAIQSLGIVRRHMGATEQAYALLVESLEMFREMLRPNHPKIAETLHALGLVYHEWGQPENALGCLEEGLEIRQQVFDTNHPLVKESIESIVGVKRGILV